MAVFIAHSDESAVAESGREFLVLGYAGSELDWPYFAKAWQERVLDGPPKIPYLHMRVALNRQWQRKHGITSAQMDMRLSEATDVLYSSGFLTASWAVIQRADLKSTIHAEYERLGLKPDIGLDKPDYLCFIAYVPILLAEVYKRCRDVERVNFIVEIKSGVTEHIRAFHDDISAQLETPLKELVGTCMSVPMEDVLPLQAADFMSWHLQRYYACGSDGTRMKRADARRLGLLAETAGDCKRITKEDLEALASRFRPLIAAAAQKAGQAQRKKKGKT